MSYWLNERGQNYLRKFDRVNSACVWSDHIGVSIIIYFYVFNLTNGSNFQKNIDNPLNLLQNCIQKFESFMTCVDEKLEKKSFLFSWKRMNFLIRNLRIFGILENNKIWSKKFRNPELR